MDRTSIRRFWSIAVLVLWLVAGREAVWPEPSTEPLPPAKLLGEAASTGRRLTEAASRVQKKQWADAIEEYQRILDECGDDLVALDPQKPNHCVQARRLCHIAIAGMPEAHKLYRARVDEQAKKWLEAGIKERDAAMLRRLVDQAFCSRHTDRALDLLGDLAFERGDFEEAEQWWRMVARPASGKANPGDAGLSLVFPDPQVEVAQVRAKQVLVLLVRGERDAALAELKAFRTAHAKAEGHFAGRKGNYADILQKLAIAEPSGPADEQPWTTVGGDAARNLSATRAPRCRWLDEPWRVRLDGSDPVKDPVDVGKVLTPTKAAQAYAFLPTIINDLVLVCDARTVTAHDLFTGKRIARCDLIDDLKNGVLELDTKLPLKTDARFSVTVGDGRVYARLGATGLAKAPDGKGFRQGKGDSFLVCLGMPDAKEGRFPLQWQAKARVLDTEAAFFEGSPVEREGRVYIARTRFANDGRSTTAIDCFSAETGARRWERDVCEARESWEGEPRYRHHLLTLGGGQVFYCSHSGAVVALDAAGGKRAWAVRYARRGSRTADGQPSPRDLAPCVYAGGRLFIAPADHDRILCLDAVTGRTLWESKPIEVVHLLGVSHGKLIFTTGSQPRGIRAVDAATGEDLPHWQQPADGTELPTLGRGLLAGSRVFWPTVDGLRILNQEDGEAADPPMPNTVRGNLAVGKGCLIVATDRELLGYVPESHFLENRRKEAAAQPASALVQFRLALAQADSGQDADAVESLTKAERLAAGERRQMSLLHSRARSMRHELLTLMAERAAQEKQWDAATGHLARAAASDFPPTWRLHAIVRSVDLWKQAGRFERAVEAWQSVLMDDDLRATIAANPSGLPQPGGVIAARRIDELVRAHGAPIYARFEQSARDRLAAAPKDAPERVIERLALNFPNASVTRSAMKRLTEQKESPSFAERWWLRHGTTDAERAVALAQLARGYEAAETWSAAAATWNRLGREHGALTVPSLDAKRNLAEFAALQLQNPLFKPDAAARPNLALPLSRAWHIAPISGKDDFTLLAENGAVSSCSDFAFGCVVGHSLTCHSLADGKERWTRPLHHAASWLGRHGDLTIVAGTDGATCFRATDGQVLWCLLAADTPLSDFGLLASRLLFQDGRRRLTALDVETGQLLWQHLLSAGSGPLYHADIDRVRVQSAGGYRMLDSMTGQPLGNLAAPLGRWVQPPVAVGPRHLCLACAGGVILTEAVTGKEVWRHALDRVHSLTGEPAQVVVCEECVLLLVPRNYGCELERLDLRNGVSRWTTLLPGSINAQGLSPAALDATAVYLSAGNTLLAIGLADGKRIWQQSLSPRDTRWHVVLTRQGLLAHPLHAFTDLEPALLMRRSLPASPGALLPTLAPLPLPSALPLILARARMEQSSSSFPVHCCDPRDGRPIQRLNFTASGTSASLAVFQRSAVVVTNGQMWGLR
ncbi:MAG: PQQ-binding-like beta-propeller repeat protein [Gemmataceae bacterium]|nr:PQQ-binding-like beta-propeller repeat protein [Gemmataceae bacterium]